MGAAAGRRRGAGAGGRPPPPLRRRRVTLAALAGAAVLSGRRGGGRGFACGCCCSGWPPPGWVCSGSPPPCRGWRGRPCWPGASALWRGGCGRRGDGCRGQDRRANRGPRRPPPGPRRPCCLVAVAGRGGPAADAPPAPTTVYLVRRPRRRPRRNKSCWRRRTCSTSCTLSPGRAAGRARSCSTPNTTARSWKDRPSSTPFFRSTASRDEPTTLTMPLDGVQLTGDVLLDGAPVQATALPAAAGRLHAAGERPAQGRRTAAQGGTALPHARDRHAGGAERPVHGAAPGRRADSRCASPAGRPTCKPSVKYGAQKVSAEGDFLEAELGRVSAPVHCPVAAGRLGGAPGRGAVSGSLFLGPARGRQPPDGVPVVRASRRLADGAGGEGPPGTGSARRGGAPAALDGGPLRLRDWQVRGRRRRSRPRNELCLSGNGGSGGAAGAGAAGAACRPRSCCRCPRRRAGRCATRAPTWPTACRGWTWSASTRWASPASARRSSRRSGRPRRGPTRARWPTPRRILREDDNHPPVLGLKVQPSAAGRARPLDMEVRVGPRQADVRATAVLTAPDGDLSLVQWEVQSPQPFTVTGVVRAEGAAVEPGRRPRAGVAGPDGEGRGDGGMDGLAAAGGGRRRRPSGTAVPARGLGGVAGHDRSSHPRRSTGPHGPGLRNLTPVDPGSAGNRARLHGGRPGGLRRRLAGPAPGRPRFASTRWPGCTTANWPSPPWWNVSRRRATCRR